MSGRLVLEACSAAAEIALGGAEVRSWSVSGVPLMWEPVADIWPDVAPILFPVVGWSRANEIRVAGQTFPLGLHGFARTKGFRVVEQGRERAVLRLEESHATRPQYPFEWTLDVEYVLGSASLEMRLTIENRSKGPMPYACGIHPGFRWPFAGGEPDDYAIVFDEREGGTIPVISPDGLFTHQSRKIFMDGRRLPLSPELMAREALCFLDARSGGLKFTHTSGAAIAASFENFPHIALWSRPPGRFLCIEAWTGHGDFVDADGDLFRKPSMRHLKPGERATHAAKFFFVSPDLLFRSERLAGPGKPDR